MLSLFTKNQNLEEPSVTDPDEIFYVLEDVIKYTNIYEDAKPKIKKLCEQNKLFEHYRNKTNDILLLDEGIAKSGGFEDYEFISVIFILMVEDGLFKKDILEIMQVSNSIIDKRLRRFSVATDGLIPSSIQGLKQCDSVLNRLRNFFKYRYSFDSKLYLLKSNKHKAMNQLARKKQAEKKELLAALDEKYTKLENKLDNEYGNKFKSLDTKIKERMNRLS